MDTENTNTVNTNTVPDDTIITETTFSSNIITENLTTIVEEYDDSATTASIVSQIQECASQITGASFSGNGSIEDYTALFESASQIVSGTQQMTLDVDVSGFNEFGQAADDLSALFTSFIEKLQNVSIIDDTAFLQSVLSALQKVVHLSQVFGKFKETIVATSKVDIPHSCHTTAKILQGVMTEIDTAVNYINYFVSPETNNMPEGAELSHEQQHSLAVASATIDNWNALCEQGVSVAMTNNPNIQTINQVNAKLSSTTNSLTSATARLKAKFATATNKQSNI